MKKLLLVLTTVFALITSPVNAHEISLQTDEITLPTGGYVTEITEVIDDGIFDGSSSQNEERYEYFASPSTADGSLGVTYQDYYGYGLLLSKSQNLADAYVCVMNGLAAKSERIDVAEFNLSFDELKMVYFTCTNDNPQFYYILYTVYTIYTNKTTGQIVAIAPQYVTNLTDSDLTSTFENAADEVIKSSGARVGMSDYDIALMLYNELILQNEYDNDSLNKIKAASNQTEEENKLKNEYGYIHSAYGALVKKKSVCDGYSRAYQYLLYKMGIVSHVATGEANGGGHAWNLVKLDGKWYYTDVTWGDAASNGIFHMYFNMDDSILSESGHTLDDTYAMPECNSDDLFYFKVNGSIMTKDGNMENVVSQLKNNSYASVYVTGDNYNDISDWFTSNISEIIRGVGATSYGGYVPYSHGREWHLYLLHDTAAPLRNNAIEITTTQDRTCTIYLAFYDENDLLADIVPIKDVSLTTGIPKIINCTDVPNKYTKTKYFVWDGTGKISPLYSMRTESYTYKK